MREHGLEDVDPVRAGLRQDQGRMVLLGAECGLILCPRRAWSASEADRHRDRESPLPGGLASHLTPNSARLAMR